ncbi:MAG: SCP2 sterol-binding domain-containing protein [Deltaproteobacteria bacterium]|nr:SCP2 sterol-binding domain-containing protein [Deltaproteobacteria bacterium]
MMNGNDVQWDISVNKFFEDVVPQIFSDELKNHPVQDMEGLDFKLQFKITGENTVTYGIVVKNGTDLKVIPNGIPDPQINIELNEKDWRDSITGKEGGNAVMGMFFNPAMLNKGKYNSLLGVKGVLNLALARESGELFNAKLQFNNANLPASTIKMKASEYSAMLDGKINPVMAFMSGKMKISGDMGLALKLQMFIK